MGKNPEAETVVRPDTETADGNIPQQKEKRLKRRKSNDKPVFKKKKKIKARTIILLVLAVLVLGGGGYGIYKLFFYEEPVEIVTGTTVRDSITTVIEGTAVTSPTMFQMLTIPADGTIEEVFVTQSDTVEIGDPLYSLDTENVEEDIADAEATIADYEDQLEELYESVSYLTITAPFGGKLTEVFVEDGDELNTNTVLATLVDDSEMRLDLYFSVAYKDIIKTGMSAEVSISQYMTELTGTVESIKDVSYITAEGAECFKVTIVMENPGALSEGLEATASIIADGYDMRPADSGTLEAYQTKTITAKASGTVTFRNLEEALRVTNGQVLALIENDSYESQIETLEKKIDAANLNLEDLYETLDECSATAEVAGTVIFVRIEEGDEVTAGESCIAVYNTDTMEIEADINELQNEYITLGMEVTITKSGASSDQTFTGTITEVSLEATSSNGVAYFPTTITIESDGALSSGVYVTYSITAAQAENTVLAPSAAVKQTTAGTCLFIQSDTEPENAVDLGEGVVPDGFYAVVVETGMSSNNYVQIISGVDEDVTVFEQYVSTGSGVAGSDETSESQDTDFSQMPGGDFPSGGMQGGFSGGGPMG